LEKINYNEVDVIVKNRKWGENMSQSLVHVVVSIRLPAINIDESVDWYEKNLGFSVLWKTEDEADLKLEPGPFLFLKRISHPSPILFVCEGRPYPVVSIKSSDIIECHKLLVEAGEDITEITNTWNIDRLLEFNVKDPAGNLINIGNYPDLVKK
jgi:catechol 2,3-dioxygenase-like lactoylglutathione lyase family enzyme